VLFRHNSNCNTVISLNILLRIKECMLLFVSGVNSGVMLMNLTRMRAFSWTNYVVPIYKEYKLKITWGDQDIINIIFHFHPGYYINY